ncbi:MAG: hypothetical protein K2J09_00945 [Muribaculaceae bacterium]|nr:hypothetical protein [Muribaculaceae bacterium]MDE6817721.1 hypothetical protein [Muribaculaceae bacterium]
MRCAVCVGVALALCGCLSGCSSTRHSVGERVRYERHDSVRALFGEELTVRLDDVRIIPPDSGGCRIEARSARVERRREAKVEAVATDSAAMERRELSEPVRAGGGGGAWRPPIWCWLLIAAGCYILGAARRR